jgi:hypothetical protein
LKCAHTAFTPWWPSRAYPARPAPTRPILKAAKSSDLIGPFPSQSLATLPIDCSPGHTSLAEKLNAFTAAGAREPPGK